MITKFIKFITSSISNSLTSIISSLSNLNKNLTLSRAINSKSSFGQILYSFIVTFVLGKLLWTLARYLIILTLGNNFILNVFDTNFNNDFLIETYNNIKQYFSDFILKVRRFISGTNGVNTSEGFDIKDIEQLRKMKEETQIVNKNLQSLNSDEFRSYPTTMNNRFNEFSHEDNGNTSLLTDYRFYISVLVVTVTLGALGYVYWDEITAYLYSRGPSDGTGDGSTSLPNDSTSKGLKGLEHLPTNRTRHFIPEKTPISLPVNLPVEDWSDASSSSSTETIKPVFNIDPVALEKDTEKMAEYNHFFPLPATQLTETEKLTVRKFEQIQEALKSSSVTPSPEIKDKLNQLELMTHLPIDNIGNSPYNIRNFDGSPMSYDKATNRFIDLADRTIVEISNQTENFTNNKGKAVDLTSSELPNNTNNLYVRKTLSKPATSSDILKDFRKK